jgi:hypothetical protein
MALNRITLSIFVKCVLIIKGFLSSRARHCCHRECDIIVIARHHIVIARNVAISPLTAGKQRKERLPRRQFLSSRGTIFLSSRGTWRSRLCRAGKQRKERLPRYARNDKTTSQARLSMTSRGTWRSRLCRAGKQSKERLPRYARNDKTNSQAYLSMSSRGTKRSRLSVIASATFLSSRVRHFCHREERGDLGCPEQANS